MTMLPAITLKPCPDLINEAPYLCLETYVLILDPAVFSRFWPEQLFDLSEVDFKCCCIIPESKVLIPLSTSTPLSAVLTCEKQVTSVHMA